MLPFLVLGMVGTMLVIGAVKDRHPLAGVIERLGGTAPAFGSGDVVVPGKRGFVGPTTTVAQNQATGERIRRHIERTWPTARYAGMCACRHERGTGSNPDLWSSHAWCGAVDFFGPTHHATDEVVRQIKAWGNSVQGAAMGVVFALIDEHPGDVHVQYIPNPPAGAVPPCAQGESF